jgi:activating signal cointegrator complex subunit 1
MPPRLTHFLCLPLVTSTSRHQLQASLHAFGIDVVKETAENPAGIPEQSIRPVGTLHLTLGVMSLLTPERINNALATLKSLDLTDLLRADSSIIENATGRRNDRDQGSDLRGKASRPLDHAETLKVTLRGLASMHEPSKTSVLFAKPVDEDLHLQSFCVKLRDVFAAADLLVPDKRP